MRNLIITIALFAAAVFFTSCGEKKEPMEQMTDSNRVVNVYSHRSYDVDQQLYDAFEEETGIKVNVISDDADKLIAKLQMASAGSDADVLITVDAARLYRAYDAGLFDKLDMERISGKVGEQLIGADGSWVALTKRARVVAFNPEKVDKDEIVTWDDLTQSQYKGKIAVRSSDNVYNQSLLAAMISAKGTEYAENWAKGIVDNMVSDPAGSDRDQIRKVASGQADIAIVNTYYYGLLSASENEADREVASKVALAFPVIPDGGVHVNVSGIGLLKSAKNKENALELINYLISGNAQNIYSEMNFEYPANPNAIMNKDIATWGDFEADSTPLDSLGYYNSEAVKVFDKAGWK